MTDQEISLQLANELSSRLAEVKDAATFIADLSRSVTNLSTERANANQTKKYIEKVNRISEILDTTRDLTAAITSKMNGFGSDINNLGTTLSRYHEIVSLLNSFGPLKDEISDIVDKVSNEAWAFPSGQTNTQNSPATSNNRNFLLCSQDFVDSTFKSEFFGLLFDDNDAEDSSDSEHSPPPSSRKIDSDGTEIEVISVKRSPTSILETCPVCTEQINKKSRQSAYLKCGHWFHYDCIEEWLQNKDKCPLCRIEVREVYKCDG